MEDVDVQIVELIIEGTKKAGLARYCEKDENFRGEVH